MTDELFSYQEYEYIRERLLQIIHKSMTQADKTFLLSVKNVTPDWSIYDFRDFPAINWKLQNLEKLKANNPDKHRELYETLENKLMGIKNA